MVHPRRAMLLLRRRPSQSLSKRKIILNKRVPVDCLRSMERTLFTAFRWPSWQMLRYTDPNGYGAWCRHNEVIWNHFCDGDYENGEKCKSRFREHCEHARKVVPVNRLLEFDIREGWTPVTNFLGLREFRGAVTRKNAAEFSALHTKGWWVVLLNNVIRLTKFGIGVVAIEFGAILAKGGTSSVCLR